MTDHYEKTETLLRFMQQNPANAAEDTIVQLLFDIRVAVVALTHATLAVAQAMPMPQ